MYPMILTGSYLNIFIEGKSYNVDASYPAFQDILDAIKVQNWPLVAELVDLATTVVKKSNGEIEVDTEAGVLLYEGEVLNNTICDRILGMIKEGWDASPMINFLKNLMQNPSASAKNELYLFMEANRLPVTPDGHFLAYKVVTHDFKDKHTKTFDNSVGSNPKMDRELCDTNRDRTCSTGLHFCGFDYLSHFGGTGDQIVVVKVNPKDVTSIPSDYNNAKGRACNYWVVAHHGVFEDSFKTDYLATSHVDDFDTEDYNFEDEEQEESNENEEYSAVIIDKRVNVIKYARQLIGVSQRELADFCGRHRSTLWNAENGNPKAETIDFWLGAMSSYEHANGTVYDLQYDHDARILRFAKN